LLLFLLLLLPLLVFQLWEGKAGVRS